MGKKKREGWCREQYDNAGFTWSTSNRFSPLISLHESTPVEKQGPLSFVRYLPLSCNQIYSLVYATLSLALSLAKFILQTSECGANYIYTKVQFTVLSQTILLKAWGW